MHTIISCLLLLLVSPAFGCALSVDLASVAVSRTSDVYTLVVGNAGPVSCVDVVTTVRIPAGSSFALQAGGSLNGGGPQPPAAQCVVYDDRGLIWACYFGALAPGATKTHVERIERPQNAEAAECDGASATAAGGKAMNVSNCGVTG